MQEFRYVGGHFPGLGFRNRNIWRRGRRYRPCGWWRAFTSTRGNHCARIAITSGAKESVMAKHMTRRQLARSIVAGTFAMLISTAVIFAAARHLAG